MAKAAFVREIESDGNKRTISLKEYVGAHAPNGPLDKGNLATARCEGGFAMVSDLIFSELLAVASFTPLRLAIPVAIVPPKTFPTSRFEALPPGIPLTLSCNPS
jgi:hypothetical protein